MIIPSIGHTCLKPKVSYKKPSRTGEVKPDVLKLEATLHVQNERPVSLG